LQLQAARGIAFLIATHNPALARRADRIYRLVEGRAREHDATADGDSGLV
jgi:ABC-type lipoprotein export system ATPase subunit